MQKNSWKITFQKKAAVKNQRFFEIFLNKMALSLWYCYCFNLFISIAVAKEPILLCSKVYILPIEYISSLSLDVEVYNMNWVSSILNISFGAIWFLLYDVIYASCGGWLHPAVGRCMLTISFFFTFPRIVKLLNKEVSSYLKNYNKKKVRTSWANITNWEFISKNLILDRTCMYTWI